MTTIPDYFLSAIAASSLFSEVGVPRSPRTVKRYCVNGHLECTKIESETTEEIQVGGKTLSCRRFVIVKVQGDTKIRVVTWATSKIPGGIARTEIRPLGAAEVMIRIEAQEWKME